VSGVTSCRGRECGEQYSIVWGDFITSVTHYTIIDFFLLLSFRYFSALVDINSIVPVSRHVDRRESETLRDLPSENLLTTC
jgi:hypothetical protein